METTTEGQGGSPTPEGDQQQTAGTTTTQAPKWTAQLPTDLKDHEWLNQFGTIGDLGKAALDLKGKADGAIKVPGDDATEEQKAEFRKALGVPEKPEGYELEVPDTADQGLVTWYRDTAHHLGLSAAQATSLFQSYNGMVAQKIQAAQEARETALAADMEAIKTEWGDNYEANAEVVRRAQEKFGNSDVFKQFLTQHNAENNPVLVRFFFEVGKAMLDDKAAGGSMPPRTERKPGMNYTTMDQFTKGG